MNKAWSGITNMNRPWQGSHAIEIDPVMVKLVSGAEAAKNDSELFRQSARLPWSGMAGWLRVWATVF